MDGCLQEILESARAVGQNVTPVFEPRPDTLRDIQNQRLSPIRAEAVLKSI
jgi:hypothetical protein